MVHHLAVAEALAVLAGGVAQLAEEVGALARALLGQPQLLMLDEPTSGLDQPGEAAFYRLIEEVRRETGAAVLMISHDLNMVVNFCDRVLVMYRGAVVDTCAARDLVRSTHPYTQGLIRSIPRIDTAAVQHVRLESIPGTVPKLIAPAEGCRFADRCRFVTPECRTATPPLREISPGHKVACILDEFPA